jgi:BirA family transcriptional regulator, biotin operon repressor / biotin---[acetyl-CoA-carboxylase] ligase
MLTRIIQFDSLPSTNQEAANRALAGAAEGLCIIAAEQTAGRGRLQRNWVSQKGAGLYFSILLRPKLEAQDWSLITLMAAVAVHDALLEVCGLQTDIKWPNDLMHDGKKLCGILAETFETNFGRAVIVGIGVNLKADNVPPELVGTATSVETATGTSCELNELVRSLISFLSERYDTLHKPGGAESILSAWSARSSFSDGRMIHVAETNENFVGTTRGLERDGALRVETSAGEIRIVRAGDVTAVRVVNK